MKKHRDGSWSDKATRQIEPHMSVPWLLSQRRAAHPNDVCMEVKAEFGSFWRKMTISKFDDAVVATARGLIGLGLQPGESIGILAATSYTWTLLDMAALSAGLVVVPIYESDSAEQIEWILKDSHVRVVFADTAAHVNMVESVRTDHLLSTILMDTDGLASIYTAGNTIPESAVFARRDSLRSDSLATIIYTSGTTGQPKGTELTHGNLVFSTFSVHQVEGEIINTPETRVLLFLPLAHIMARIVCIYALAGRGRVGHVANTNNLVTDLGSFKPTALLVVPRVLEKVYNAAEAASGGGKKLKIFRWAAQVAVANSMRSHHGIVFRVKRAIAKKLVWSKMTAVLGADCHYAVSAGAPLGKRLGHVYRGIGLTVIEAFGLTETTGTSTANRPNSFVMGSVGQPLPGTGVKIASDGEVLLRGSHVMRGYHNNPVATSEAIDSDGWFHTGDVGDVDNKGFLTITGRKKDLIVTAGGKNVAPAVLEDKLSGHPLISQVVAIGDKRPFVGALITLDAQMLPGWLKTHGQPPMTVAEAAENPAILESLQRGIERTNAQVSRAESIRKFRILNGEFTQENGLLTPSLKIKRAAVLSRFASEIDELYRDNRSVKKA